MKVVMDADCLIKLTKANLKELVCDSVAVVIPRAVKEEVVDEAGPYPDAKRIQENIDKGLITIHRSHDPAVKGEAAALAIFSQGKFDAVCSDDKRFIKRLRLFEIPYITPAVFVAVLLRKGKLRLTEAHKRLDSLSPYISDDEYTTVKLVLDNWRTR
jgi:rRNA-processing protein FCF1